MELWHNKNLCWMPWWLLCQASENAVGFMQSLVSLFSERNLKKMDKTPFLLYEKTNSTLQPLRCVFEQKNQTESLKRTDDTELGHNHRRVNASKCWQRWIKGTAGFKSQTLHAKATKERQQWNHGLALCVKVPHDPREATFTTG